MRRRKPEGVVVKESSKTDALCYLMTESRTESYTVCVLPGDSNSGLLGRPWALLCPVLRFCVVRVRHKPGSLPPTCPLRFPLSQRRLLAPQGAGVRWGRPPEHMLRTTSYVLKLYFKSSLCQCFFY